MFVIRRLEEREAALKAVLEALRSVLSAAEVRRVTAWLALYTTNEGTLRSPTGPRRRVITIDGVDYWLLKRTTKGK